MYLRDGIGRFISTRRKVLIVIFWAVIFSGLVYAVTETLVVFNGWSALNKVQVPFEVHTPITFRDMVVRREPIRVLSPLAQDLVKDDPEWKEELTDIEKLICDTWGPYDCKVAIAVAKAESGLREDAWNANKNGTIDMGIFQVNSIHWSKEGCSMKEIVIAEKNIKCAHKIWENGGWSHWVVFNTGAFRSKL